MMNSIDAKKLFTIILDRSIVGGLLGCSLAFCDCLVQYCQKNDKKYSAKFVQKMSKTVAKGGTVGMICGSIVGLIIAMVS
ncbi:hypothetical protein Phum_PHUM590040 [Pediculus humanus corporis]|uniref:Uncharacterized protein n=1 Tax=Pediculus humanus subsp. corporis TaxID=121224 RepID=E0W2D3_PEDHC|nr:uncharacterized protein Phum_PHUM590040 [Pediculus humanus corporis]EEB19789.1 hypothetical protein Phum_PHUM590040 [Pediculus humanus corporis]